jgi:DNA sulfur modification protein DndD
VILKRIRIENFRQFFGTNEIVFARPGAKNVTVIVGTNGAGKTTLLNAITWCLYGKIAMPQEDEFLSNRAATHLKGSEAVQVEVELMFEANGQTYTARRQQRYKKRDDGAIEVLGQTVFEIFELTAQGETRTADDPYMKVEQLVPKGLSRFFFFRGEDMEALAGSDKLSEDRLRTAVETFLELRILDRAKEHLQKAGKKLEQSIRQNATGETLALSEDIARTEEELEAMKAKHENLISEERAAKTLQISLERKLAEVEELRPFVEEKAIKVARLSEVNRQVKSLEADLMSDISKSAYLTLAPSILEDVERFAAEAVQSGELPAKIKPRFVDDLFEMGECICGRPLTEDARTALAKFRGKTGIAGIEEAISTLRNAITAMRGRIADYQVAASERRLKLTEVRKTVRELSADISTLTSKLEGSPVSFEEIQLVQRSYAKAREDHEALKLRIASVESDVRNLDGNLRALKEDRESKNAGAELVNKLERQRASVDRLYDVASKLRDEWCDVVRRYLDVRLKETWSRITQLERVVEFNERFELTISEYGPQGNLIRSAPSQANIRALALAFIGALIALAKEVNDYVNETDDQRMPYRGGVYGLVMDAPFATMDAHFKERLPKGLVELVPQVILVTSYDQWIGEIETAMAPSVGKAYVLELHNPKIGESAKSIKVNGVTVPYEVSEPNEKNDWTLIKEVA